MSGVTVECPSGLVVTLREFKVTDENMLANKKAIRQGTGITDLLNHVTLHVDDPGQYQLRDKDKKHDGPWLDWAKVLQGDRMVVLRDNRVETWGHEMTDSRPCRSCRLPVNTDFDLRDIPVQELPKTSLEHFKNPSVPLFVKLPRCGVRVGFRLLRGEDELGIKKIQKRSKDELSSAYLRFRTLEIEGVLQPEWDKWLKNLGGFDASYLRAAFDQADCGLDQSWQFECCECDHIWKDDVKLSEDFLFPMYRGRIFTSK